MGDLNSIQFDDINTADYGIFVSMAGNYNAPARRVEVINIPGRNGGLLIDQNAFEDIEVTYPAFCYEETYAGFTEKVDALRNALASKVGFKKLEDTFHPDEYRLASFQSGFEINPLEYNSGAHFDIVFHCKPQRYLKTGEIPVEVSSGDVITNPTYFESKPLIKAWGNGTINLDGKSIAVNGDASLPLGEVTMLRNQTIQAFTTPQLSPITNAFNPSDTVRWSGASFYTELLIAGGEVKCDESGVPIVNFDTPLDSNLLSVGVGAGRQYNTISLSFDLAEGTFQGTTGSARFKATQSLEFTVIVDGIEQTARLEYQVYILRAPNYEYFQCVSVRDWVTQPEGVRITQASGTWETGTAVADSTISSAGNPADIDLEVGEAYKMNGSKIVSLNKFILLPTDFPTLKAGDNTITFDNTFSKVEIVPRWWKI